MTNVPQTTLAPGFSISKIIKGGWQLSQGHRAELQSDPLRDMVAFAEAGVTTFDCADIYTGVEELIGKFLKFWKEKHGHQGNIRILTKFVPDYDALETLDKKYVERIIDRSLRRLGQERLDMVQFSWWNYQVPRYVETAGWLQELQKSGKIELLSGTNFNAQATKEILDAGIQLSTMQLQYSVLDNRPEQKMSQLCTDRNLFMLCYGTMAGGFLSNRWLGKPEPLPPFENRSLVKYKLMIDTCGGWDWFQSLLETLDGISKKHQVSMSQVAGRFMLDQNRVGGLIIGASSASHLQENLGLFSFELDESDRQAIQNHRGNIPASSGDVFDLERIKEGPHGSIMRYNLNQLSEN